MKKSDQLATQRARDWEARMKPALPDDKKQLIAKFKKHLIKTNAPHPYNAGIYKCINDVKEL